LGIYAPDPELGWVLKPDLRVPRRWAGRTIMIRTDAAGQRIPDVKASKIGGEQIAFAGDSYVFGNEVNAEETFVYLLGEALGKASVNLGVGGYNLSQECLSLRRFMAQKTGIAQSFLVMYVGNDIEYGAYSSRTVSVDELGYLRDTPSGRWSEVWRFAQQHSRFIFYLQTAWRVLSPARPVAVSPARRANVGHRWIYDEAAFSRDRLEPHRRVLAMLRDDARRRDTPVSVVLMPEKDQVYGSLSDLPNRMISSMISELGMPVIDLLPDMRAAVGVRPPLWHDIAQGHLSPEGHRLVAETLIGRLGQNRQME